MLVIDAGGWGLSLSSSLSGNSGGGVVVASVINTGGWGPLSSLSLSGDSGGGVVVMSVIAV